MITRSTRVQADKSTDEEEQQTEPLAHEARTYPIDRIALQDKENKPKRRLHIKQFVQAPMHRITFRKALSKREIRENVIVSTDKKRSRKDHLLDSLHPVTVQAIVPVRLLQTITAQYQEQSDEVPAPHIKHRREVERQHNMENEYRNGGKALQSLCICSREHLNYNFLTNNI